MQDQSIALYWLIMCCNWAGDRAFRFSDLKAASGIKTYSLRKLSRYFQKLQQWMVFMLFSVMKETILFYSGRCRIILDWSRVSDQLLVFDGVEDFNNGETELSESSVGLKVQSEFSKITENAYLVWAGCL